MVFVRSYHKTHSYETKIQENHERKAKDTPIIKESD